MLLVSGSDSSLVNLPGTPSLTTPATRDGVKLVNRKCSRPREASQSAPESATLRHFSLKVCHVVNSMATTSYTRVADALVLDMLGDRRESSQESDERNIRRCVYRLVAQLESITYL